MFEGTDLSVAFGGLGSDTGGYGNYESGGSFGGGGGLYDSPAPSGMMQTPSGPKMLPSSPPPAPMPELTVPKSDKMYSQNDYYNDTASGPTKPKVKVVSANTFWDRVGAKKMEVAKVIVLSLIILLAFALDHLVVHYLTNFFGQSFLTETQEFLIRLAYPVSIVIVIWLLKAI